MADVFDPTTATDDQILTHLRNFYPALSAFLADDEVRGVLINSVRAQQSEPEMDAALRNTAWWKTNSLAKRQWASLITQDPADAAARVKQQADQIVNLYGEIGTAPGGDVNAQATYYLQNGYSQAEIRADIASKARATAGPAGGTLEAVTQQINDIANSYLVSLSPAQAKWEAAGVWAGTQTLDTVKGNLAATAKRYFPQFNDDLDRGVTVRDALQPVVNTVASTLEVAPASINLLDPKWSPLWQHQDPTTHQLRAMTVAEGGQWARGQDAWRSTVNANQQADQTINGVLKTMGATA